MTGPATLPLSFSRPRIYWPLYDAATSKDAEILREPFGAAEDTSLSQSEFAGEDSLLEVLESGTVRVEAFQQAAALLDVLPDAIQSPEIVLETDGQIGFDWDNGPGRMLSLNVGRNGMIGYAASIGLESSYGRLPFTGLLPDRIMDLLLRVAETQPAGR